KSSAQVGDTLFYLVTITNTSTSNSPPLINFSLTESVPDPTPPVIPALAPGQSFQFSYSHVITAGDPNPLTHTVTASFHPRAAPRWLHQRGRQYGVSFDHSHHAAEQVVLLCPLRDPFDGDADRGGQRPVAQRGVLQRLCHRGLSEVPRPNAGGFRGVRLGQRH